jgi:hypothetical protein
MAPQYVPLHTLRIVCQLVGMPEARKQIPVAVSRAESLAHGLIVFLDRPA